MNDESLRQKTRATGTGDRYLAFSLCGEQFAIPLVDVKEVIGMTETTPVPCMPAHFKGILNLRGQIISVIDLRAKLRLKKAEFGRETSIVILDMEPLRLGVIVDSIDCVMAVTEENLSEAPRIGGGSYEKDLIGVARRDDRLTLLLDIRAALDTDESKTMKNQIANKAA